MTLEKWHDIIAMIEDKFSIEQHDKIESEECGGMIVETIIFESPLGKIKLELTIKALVIDKKTSYSKRAGSNVAVEYIYSDEEKVNYMDAYKMDDNNEWQKINENIFEK